MNITKEQAIAYTEVIEVLKHMPEQDVKKIPEKVLNFYNCNKDESYYFKLDSNKPFEEQVLTEKTKIVLAILFRDYWATEKQREAILQNEKKDLQLNELEKQQKYDINIFKNSEDTDEISKVVSKESVSLVEYKKETWYTKFINFIKSIFGKRK